MTEKITTNQQPAFLGDIVAVIDSSEPQREIFTAIDAGGVSASLGYNESMLLRFDGAIDEPLFRSAVEHVAQRHDALRITFNRYGTQVCIHRQLSPDYRYRDVSTQADPAQCVDEERVNAVSVPFDLHRGPLFRVVLLKLSAQRFAAILTLHHIVCDGWSFAVLLQDLAELYSALAERRPSRLAAPALFLQYLQRLRSNDYLQAAARDIDYWSDRFRDSQPVLDLPADYPRPPLRTFNARRIDRQLGADLVAALKKTGAANKSSFVATLLTGFVVLLQRLTGQTDFVVGMPAAGQSIEDMPQLIGHCVNTLPIRCRVDPEQSFAHNLQQVRDGLFDTYDHQRLTFGSLVARLGMRRDASRIPLVPVLYNIDQGMQGLEFAGVAVAAESNPRLAEGFEIFLNATERRDGLLLECQFNTDLYSDQTIARWLALFESLLRQIAQAPTRAIAAYDVLTADERALWQRINATAADYPRAASLHGLLAEAIARHAQVPVWFGAEALTQGELDQRAGQLAARLRQQGVQTGDFVGICLQRSPHMLVAMLGVLKAGAAYVPLDPDYPPERLALMIEDSGLATLLVDGGVPPGIDSARLARVIEVAAAGSAGEVFAAAVAPTAPAYMIYTSGSTGRPKGVVVPHGSIVNFLCSMAREPGLGAHDHLLAVTTISFDIAVLELYLPLLVGATLTIASRDDTKDGQRLRQRIEQQRITAMQATPSTWRLLFAAAWRGAAEFRVFTGGEALPQTLADELCAAAGEVWNLYGPTETTVWSTVARVRAGQPVTLGHPIANTRLAIVDAQDEVVALGVPGELLIGGDGVTLGYWQRPELNAERFVSRDGSTFYRTGDLAKLCADGTLLYLGRLDNQVKLRGYRIELGEIEARLASHPAIVEAVVVVQDFGADDQRLVAFYRGKAGSEPALAALREHLAAVLPAFMVPQQFVALERFPLTPNGKVDRKALASLTSAAVSMPVASSAGDEQADPAVLAAFRTFLKQAQLPANADFFQHGGHSLLAMRMVAELNKTLGCELALTDLFQAPTAAALSVLLAQRADAEPVATIPRLATRDRFRMSLQQRRLWYLEQLEGFGMQHNLPASWRLRGALDVAALAAAVDAFCARHDVLRTNLVEEADGLFQRVRPPRTGVLQVSAVDGAEVALDKLLTQRKAYRFNLAVDELFQAELIRLGEQDHVLFVLVHHAIFDGWSFDVMLAELAELYNAAIERRPPQLPELPVQYGDFAEWMRTRTEQGNPADLAFWLDHLSDELPVLELPHDGPRPEFQAHLGAGFDFAIEAPVMARLAEFARQQGATLYMTMLAIFKLLLWRYSGQRDVIVGTPISGRSHAEINELVGFFVNTLTLRDRLDPAQDFTQLLRQVKQTCLDGFAHQNVPFEQLVEQINPPRDPSRTPLYQVMLMYQDITNRIERFNGLAREQINIDRPGVQTDLDFWLKWDGATMFSGFEYDRELLTRATIDAMHADLQALVRRVPDQAQLPLWQLANLPSEDLLATLQRLNDTAMALPDNALLHALFEQQVRKTPQAVAVRYRGVRLSYAELDARANRVARWLASQGVRPGALVGVALSPSAWLQATLLGVLKSGCAYVPIDPAFPLERIRYMIDNSTLAHLLFDDALDERLRQSPGTPATHIDALVVAVEAFDASSPRLTVTDDQPAYVIYTSGSTGQPKGVVVTHRNVVNYVLSMARCPGFGPGDCILAATTLSFDIAVTELLLPLVAGGSSVLVDRDVAIDGDLLHEVIETAGITVYQATPSSWRLLLAAGWHGSRELKALCGGEALPADLIAQLLPRVGELWNVYGPTETTVWSTCHRVTSVDDAGIVGRPLANTRCYILNEHGQPVPVGVTGELCIGGVGVAAGYLNRPELTAERFVDDPFAGGKLYRTGDMARLRHSGVVEFLGRSDHQVKVRGYRIELGEIETALAQFPAVREAVVVAREFDGGDLRLAAYVVANRGDSLDSTELRRYLRDRLPPYMVPQHIMQLDALPMTPNLKVDRKALPMPVADVVPEARLPTSASQLLLAAIWKDVLKIDSVSLEDNFFDCGGHSLTAIDAIRRVYQETGHRFEVREFIMETLERLSAKLDADVVAEAGSAGAGSAAPASILSGAASGFGKLFRRLSGKDD